MKTKKLLYILMLFTSLGMTLELLLLEHFESFYQAIPFIVLVVFIPGMLWVRSQKVKMLLSLLLGLTGIIGMGFHLTSNRDFEKEMRPSVSGLDLFFETLTGALPVMAPGAFISLAIIGYIITKTE